MAHVKTKQRASGAGIEWSARRVSKKSQRDGARRMAPKALGYSLAFILSTMGSQREAFKHEGDVIWFLLSKTVQKKSKETS